MKTPREVILQRHQNAEPKLAAMSGADLAACARQGRAGERSEAESWFSPSRVAGNFWREAIQPWRKTWAGLAAAWLVILMGHFAGGERPRSVIAAATKPNPEILMALADQKRFLAQLLGPAASSPAISRPRAPGPRSDLRLEQAAV